MQMERLRACPNQFVALVEFMERHGDLSKLSRLKSDRLWQALVIILNSIDAGVVKSLDKWKKVWADYKAKTKKKYLLRQLQNSNGTSRESAQSCLSALEQRVIEILKLSVANQKQETDRSQVSDVQENEGEILYILEVPENNDTLVQSPSSPLESPDTPEMPSPIATDPLPSPPPPPSPPPRYTQQSPSLKARRLQSLRTRRRLRPTFTTSEFVAVEKRRLELEEARDKRLHEREMERLRLESQRIEVTREHNQLLQRLGDIAQKFISTFTQNQPSPPAQLPSTDVSVITQRLIEALSQSQTRSSAPLVPAPVFRASHDVVKLE